MVGDPEITILLKDCSSGDETAGEKLTPLIYDELQRHAARLFRRENPAHTLQPTALVHEAYAKLIDVDVPWQDRNHFFAMAARMMKRLLINHANARNAVKRGGDAIRVTFEEGQFGTPDHDAVLLDLTQALSELETIDKRKADLIELQYFGGLTLEEIASVTGLSSATIGRDLRFARAWLKDRLTQQT